ncbi:MAG TPA: DUF421 domain-containing protein [Bacillus sp. (in: firmicutes)]|nr:DUF421 domain-containing protein [Bacillus sp. (in: firmicutes)]
MTLLDMLLKTLITFIILYGLCRILGKKLISQMTFFDFVAGVTLGSISASFLFTNNIPIYEGLASLIFFALLSLVLDISSMKWLRFQKIANGEPSIIIQNGKIREKEMIRARLTMNELLFLLRKKNAFYLDEVELAIFETDGTLSVLKKVQNQPVTKIESQTHLYSLPRGITKTVIKDGKVIHENLEQAGKDEAWLLSVLKANGMVDVSQVSIAQVDELGKVYIDRKDE